MKVPPTTDARDFFNLLRNYVRAFLRLSPGHEYGSPLSDWMKSVMARHKSENVVLNFGLKKILLVSGRPLSAHILKEPPCTHGYVEGELKRQGMSYLAPGALTISHDERWERLRVFNERVLCEGEAHIFSQTFLERVHGAFSSPVSNIRDVRRRMGETMLGIVFGDGVAPNHLAEDIQVLIGLVQSPLKRLVFGPFQKKRRAGFYRSLRQIWRETKESQQPSLLTLAHQFAGAQDEEDLIQQIPHWMFTFVGSGTDLLARTLALVLSRPDVRARVLKEIEETGDVERASTIEGLDYLGACLLESARLFSPVPRTFHRAPEGDVFADVSIPAGMEIAHYFPLNQRDNSTDPSANDFKPERWLDPSQQANSRYPNLFLSGARACPGKNLILFVCKSAIAILLKQNHLNAAVGRVSVDPLPFSFPEQEIRFHV